MVFQDFINKTKGKKIDVDGLYGGQCVDLFNYWNKLYNNVYINCKPSGYARSLAENKKNNGILKYFKETAVNNMIEGTVVVYGKCKFAPDSHVCFFIKDNGDGTFQALQQNYNSKQYVTINNNPYEGIIGAFIPNQLVQDANKDENTSKKADQVLYKGSRVQFYGCQIDDIKTMGDVTTFYSKTYGVWLPITAFYRVGADGKKYANQMSSKGNWLMNNTVYTVKSVSKNPDKAVITIEGKNYNVLSSGLHEVSNS